jgi:NTP pyrophosphatase (non-canonical NTP hydrolase)
VNTTCYLAAVEGQAARVTDKHGPLTSIEQGFGVLLEEIDEYFDEVRKKEELRSAEWMALEIIDVAVVAYRICQFLKIDVERMMEAVENRILNDPHPAQRPHAIYGLLFRYALAFGDPRAERWTADWMVGTLIVCGKGYISACNQQLEDCASKRA